MGEGWIRGHKKMRVKKDGEDERGGTMSRERV